MKKPTYIIDSKLSDTQYKPEDVAFKTNKVVDILADRGKVYGSFKVNIEARANIMDILNSIHSDKNDFELCSVDYQALNDIVIKLVRLAATPEHIDSYVDISGYSQLNIDRLKEINERD